MRDDSTLVPVPVLSECVQDGTAARRAGSVQDDGNSSFQHTETRIKKDPFEANDQ